MACPANSTAVIDSSTPPRAVKCTCIAYHRNVQDGGVDTYPGVPCDIIYKVRADIGYNDISVIIENPTHFPDAAKYAISAYKKGSATDVLPVSPTDGSTITNVLHPSVTMVNLEPGQRYCVEYKGYDASNKEVYTDIRRMEGCFVTHCGCSDTDYARSTENTDVIDGGNAESSATLTGAPRDFQVEQKEGYITFNFVDDSRCEDAFAFSRDGDSFVPDYRYLAVDECSPNIIRPGLAATDDLRKSQLTVYHEYTYCVRAVAKE